MSSRAGLGHCALKQWHPVSPQTSFVGLQGCKLAHRAVERSLCRLCACEVAGNHMIPEIELHPTPREGQGRSP
jgi:hypothetical protein